MKTIKQSILAILIIGLITLTGLYFMHGSTNISMMDENVLNTVLGIFILVSLIACIGIYSYNSEINNVDLPDSYNYTDYEDYGYGDFKRINKKGKDF